MFGLKYDADVRLLAFEAIYFGIIYFQWHYMTLELSILFLSVLALNTYFSFVGAVATHNCVHVQPFHNPMLNNIFFLVLSLTIGHPVSTFIPGHNKSHHKYMETRMDIMRTVQMKYRWNLLNLICFMPFIQPQTARNDIKYFLAQRKLGRGIWYQFLAEVMVVYGVSILYLLADWKKFIIIMFIPQFFAKYGIVSLNMLQHDGCDAESKYNFARNFCGSWLNFFCYNNGYHTIHHINPSKHWSLTKELHEKEVAPNNHAALNQESILGYMFTTYIYPGKREMYDGRPFVWPADADEPLKDWAFEQRSRN